MKRIKITAICMSLLATLSMVGCVCPPYGHYGSMHQGYAPSHIAYSSACDPCSPPIADCGVIEYVGSPHVPMLGTLRPCLPRVANCRTTFSNLGNGVLLIGRGVLDIAAAPFVVVGNVLSSGCRYEVLTYRDSIPYCPPTGYQIIDPCCPVGISSGCDTCANGYTNGIQYNVSPQHLATPLPAPVRSRSNTVIQAAYQEPSTPAVRFVQPRSR